MISNLDEYDIADGITIVDKAVKFPQGEHRKRRYEPETSYDVRDERDGLVRLPTRSLEDDTSNGEGGRNRSYHPYGFTVEEIKEINARLKERRKVKMVRVKCPEGARRQKKTLGAADQDDRGFFAVKKNRLGNFMKASLGQVLRAGQENVHS